MSLYICWDGHHVPLNLGGIPPHSHSLTLHNLIWRFNWEHEIRRDILRSIKTRRVRRCTNLHSYACPARTETRSIADLRKQVSPHLLHIHSGFIDPEKKHHRESRNQSIAPNIKQSLKKRVGYPQGARARGATLPAYGKPTTQKWIHWILAPDRAQSRASPGTVNWNRCVLVSDQNMVTGRKTSRTSCCHCTQAHIHQGLAHQWWLEGQRYHRQQTCTAAQHNWDLNTTGDRPPRNNPNQRRRTPLYGWETAVELTTATNCEFSG